MNNVKRILCTTMEYGIRLLFLSYICISHCMKFDEISEKSRVFATSGSNQET